MSLRAQAFARDLKNAIIDKDKRKANAAVLELVKLDSGIQIDTEMSYVPETSFGSLLKPNERVLAVNVECMEKKLDKRILLTVTPKTTIEEMKKQVFDSCNIKREYQFWIIGNEVMRDKSTIGNCIGNDIVLYISANVFTPEECKKAE